MNFFKRSPMSCFFKENQKKKIKFGTLGTCFGTFSVGPMLEMGLEAQKITKIRQISKSSLKFSCRARNLNFFLNEAQRVAFLGKI